jgi:hypothetical protein
MKPFDANGAFHPAKAEELRRAAVRGAGENGCRDCG